MAVTQKESIGKINKGCLPCTVPHYRAELFTIFGSYFGRNNVFIN
jgi:hypothetical protein